MSINRDQRELMEVLSNTVVTLTGTGDTESLTAKDQVVEVVATGATGACTIYLPDVSDAAGKLYSFWAHGAPGGDITVTAKHGATYPETAYAMVSLVLDGDGDRFVLYSDGRGWILLGGEGDTHAT